MSNRILELLQIMDLAKQWPQFQAIHDVAREDLLKANEEAKAEIAKRASARAKKEAAEKAEEGPGLGGTNHGNSGTQK